MRAGRRLEEPVARISMVASRHPRRETPGLPRATCACKSSHPPRMMIFDPPPALGGEEHPLRTLASSDGALPPVPSLSAFAPLSREPLRGRDFTCGTTRHSGVLSWRCEPGLSHILPHPGLLSLFLPQDLTCPHWAAPLRLLHQARFSGTPTASRIQGRLIALFVLV